jgi:hypothetical protein
LRHTNAELEKRLEKSDAIHDSIVDMLNEAHEEELLALTAIRHQELEDAGNKAEQYRKDIGKRNVEMNSLKKKAAAAGELQKKVDEMERKCSGLKTIEEELARTKKELVLEKKERDFLQKQLDDLQSRRKQLENWDKLQEDLARALSARDDYKKRCEELEKKGKC